ncbi:hypothetical protein BY458DRAFT_348611 [Sporodiniella umbellata]|nr:hypothetical protein BY458DRAFT_348611 [Sporodiniella umbellata]
MTRNDTVIDYKRIDTLEQQLQNMITEEKSKSENTLNKAQVYTHEQIIKTDKKRKSLHLDMYSKQKKLCQYDHWESLYLDIAICYYRLY